MKTHICEVRIKLIKRSENLTLKELRTRAGLRQDDVAKKLDVNQAAVSRWEAGETKPSRKYHKKLAKLYGCTVDELLVTEEEK